MSEHQIVAFRAIDGPVSQKNLEYMHEQSSRAEVTAWSFENEYHYGDFRGDKLEMLRRGYDIHLHYANFGTRELMIRLPNGFPDPKAAEPYLGEDAVKYVEDKKGPGGTLCIDPYYESSDFDYHVNIHKILDRLIPLRAEILAGDLRPLYIAHLAMVLDDNHFEEGTIEGPVPAGLDQLTDAQQALAEYYGIGEAFLQAAAVDLPLPNSSGPSLDQQATWLREQPQSTKDDWLLRLISDPDANVKNEILTAYRNSQNLPSWPTVIRNRTMIELKEAETTIAQAAKLKAEEKAKKAKAKRFAELLANPDTTIQETERLVKERTTKGYSRIAELLAELRDAVQGSEKAGIAEQQAEKLRKENPNLTRLISELRKKKFLPK